LPQGQHHPVLGTEPREPGPQVDRAGELASRVARLNLRPPDEPLLLAAILEQTVEPKKLDVSRLERPLVVDVLLGPGVIRAGETTTEIDRAHMARPHEQRVGHRSPSAALRMYCSKAMPIPSAQAVLDQVFSQVASDGREHPPLDLLGEVPPHVGRRGRHHRVRRFSTSEGARTKGWWSPWVSALSKQRAHAGRR
jgi:hypothetical protein